MYKLLAFSLLLLSSSSAWAQAESEELRLLTGTVTDSEDGAGLAGVNVAVPGTSTGTVTDIDGYYELHVPDGELILRFSYIGYITQDIPLTNETVLHVELAEDLQDRKSTRLNSSHVAISYAVFCL